MRRRHQCGPREGWNIKRTRVLAVHEVASPTQMREIGEFLRSHPVSVLATLRPHEFPRAAAVSVVAAFVVCVRSKPPPPESRRPRGRVSRSLADAHDRLLA